LEFLEKKSTATKHSENNVIIFLKKFD